MLRGGCRYEGGSVSGGPWVGRPGQLQLVEEMPTGSLRDAGIPHKAHVLPALGQLRMSPLCPPLGLHLTTLCQQFWQQEGGGRRRPGREPGGWGGRGPGVPAAPLGTATHTPPKLCPGA